MKEFSPFRLDAADQSLWRDGQRVPLTPKAFAVLNYLVGRAGRLVTQNELLEALWPDTFVQPEVLKSQILDVRAALGDRPKDPLFIETVPRRGYRFIAEVREPTVSKPAPIASPAESPAVKRPVGRGEALDQLLQHLKRASSGERQVVFITGEQGLGKTTLVEAFLREVQDSEVESARGQCLEGYGTAKEPYYPVLEALGHLARTAISETVTQALATYAPTWLIQMPALLTRQHRETLQRELLGATGERMIREICEALEQIAQETTIILLFEDLHWADHATVDLITAFANRRNRCRLLVLATYRPVDIVLSQHPLKQASHFLKSHRLCRELSLSPFGESEVAEYLALHAEKEAPGPDERDLARWLSKQTEGNPLFVVTVVEHLRELGHLELGGNGWKIATPLDQIDGLVPDTLRQMIELQIEQFAPAQQATLEAGSVHGMTFSASVVTSALDMNGEEVDQLCQHFARQNHFIRLAAAEQLSDGTFSQQYTFVHAAFRGVFYHRLTPARRAKLHRRIGEAMEARHPGNRSEFAAELAGHFEQCADWPKAVEYLTASAQNAWQRLAYREAVVILEQALRAAHGLDDSTRTRTEIQILDKIAVFLQALHDMDRLIPALEELASLGATHGLVEVQTRALVALGSVRAREDARLCLPSVERLEEIAARHTDPLIVAQTMAQATTLRLSMLGWDARVDEENEKHVEIVRKSASAIESSPVVMDRCYTQWASTRYEESLRNAQESLPPLLKAGRLVRYLQGRDLVATNLAFLGKWGEALDILDEGIRDAEKNDAPMRLTMPLIFKAWVHLNVMDLEGVVRVCNRALPYLDAPFMKDRQRIGRQFAASAKMRMGNHDDALMELLTLRDEADQHPVVMGWYWTMPLQLEVTEAYLRLGNLPRARREADRALTLTLATGDRQWQSRAWETSARVALEQSNGDRAAHDAAKALATIHGVTAPLAAWKAHSTAAIVEQRLSGDGREREHWVESRNILLGLASSLSARPELQTIFLASPEVSAILAAEAASGPT